VPLVSHYLKEKKMRENLFFVLLLANISEEETRWKQEFRQYQERIQQWDYYYTKYLDLLEKNRDKLFSCLG
jgi:2-phosphoglycerate kinase